MGERNILDALDEALRAGVDIESVIAAFHSLAEQSDRETKDQMLEALDPRLREHPGERIGHVAVLAGALVELGADPLKFPPAVFDRLLAQLSDTDPASEAEQPEWYYLVERAAMACLPIIEEKATLPRTIRIRVSNPARLIGRSSARNVRHIGKENGQWPIQERSIEDGLWSSRTRTGRIASWSRTTAPSATPTFSKGTQSSAMYGSTTSGKAQRKLTGTTDP